MIQSISFIDSALFFGAATLALFWLLYEHHSGRFQRWLYILTVFYSLIVHFFLATWVMVEGLSVGPVPWVSAGIVALVLLWAVLHHELPWEHFLFFLAMASFPLVCASLAAETLVFGDLWLTVVIYLLFTIPSGLILKRHALKLPTWVAYVALALLGVYRVVGGGQFGLRQPAEIDFILLFFCAVMAGGFAALIRTGVDAPRDAHHFVRRLGEWSVPRWVDGVVLSLLLFLGLLVSGTSLSGLSFQNDEFFHVEAAQGYLETGDFVQWDFVNDAPRLDSEGEIIRYDRARPYTIQTAAALALFGMSESALRLPSLVWFLLFLAGAYITLRVWTKNVGLAFVTVLAFIFLDHFVLHSRLVRMYSMLLAVGNVSMVLWYLLYRSSIAEKFNWLRVVLYGFGAVLLTWLAIETHRLFLLFAPAFSIFLVVEWLYLLGHPAKKESARRAGLWVLGSALAAVVGLIALSTGSFASYAQFFGLRSVANLQYEIIPFSDQPIVALVLVLYVVGLGYAMRQSSGGRFIGVVSAVVILLFTFTVKRYNAMRYILFILPMALTVASVVLYLGIERLNRWMPPRVGRAATVAIVALLFVPFALPGVPVVGGLSYEGRSNLVHAEGVGHDVRTTYAYIKNVRKPAEPVFAQSFRSVYWDVDPTLIVVDLGEQKSLSVKELKAAAKEYDAMWFVWPEGKAHHLTKKVRTFIENRSEHVSESVPELMGTNVEVYYWER